MYDHAQSPRLGQPVAPESPGIRMFDGEEIPEVSFTGQIIYRKDTQQIQVFNGVAWEEVIGGVLDRQTFVGDTAPDPASGLHLDDLWYDSSNDMALSIWNGSEWVQFVQGNTAVYQGGIVTSDITINGGMSINGTTNEIASGAGATLSAGVSAPVSSPNLANDYDVVKLDTTTERSASPLGSFTLNASEIAWMAHHTGSDKLLVAQRRQHGTRIWYYNYDGTQDSTDPLDLNYRNVSGLFSVAGSAEVAFMGIELSTGRWTARLKCPDGAWRYQRIGISTSTTFEQKMLVYDDTLTTGDYWLVEHDTSTPSNQLVITKIRSINVNLGITTRINTDVGDSGIASNVLFIGGVVGQQNVAGSTQLTYAAGLSQLSKICNLSGTHSTTYQFPFNGSSSQKGFTHDGSNYYSVNSSGVLTQYSTWMWTSSISRVYTGFSWYNLASSYNTQMGAVSHIDAAKRSRVTARLPAAPVGATHVKLFAVMTNPASAAPASTAYQLQNAYTAASPVVAYLHGVAAGDSPATTNSFPSGTPGKIISAAVDLVSRPLFSVDGAGAGNWEAVAPAGAMYVWSGDQSVPPTGWLLADGTTKPQSTYASLFAAVGTAYNVGGESAGTFRLPTLTVSSLKGIIKY